MKIFERILDRRIREIVRLSDNQCGFVAGCGTINAIHAARLLVEKHREKQKPVHIGSLDLEKTFNRVPREVIWYALRQHNVPEELTEWVRMLAQRVECKLQLEPQWSFPSLLEYTKVLRFLRSSLLSSWIPLREIFRSLSLDIALC
ncbi:unnamed protein product [Heligmosomoides polygyrus]|uniref:Reverse transcriptase domain-containing protein n=1 Tax=Heligmosomoides polygyrus TaxID=6339 RepID=A0A183GU78_HELPZ|nr:unnamed protein product [Heligmosomoides polygyrus]